MREYLNRDEQYDHLMLVLAQVKAEELINSKGINVEQKELLNEIIKRIKRFTEIAFINMGDGYRRSLLNKSRDNTIQLRAKGLNKVPEPAKVDNYIDDEELHALVDGNADIDCCGCEKTNCHSCLIYRIKTHLGYEGKREDNDLCPYRKEKMELFDLNEDDEF